MSRVEKDVMVAIGVLADIRPIPRSYGHVFVNTNEELSSYYKAFPIEGGKVLTVSSGGDHILQAAYNGAKEIDAFDKNKFAVYVAKLKVAAIKKLSCMDFQSFFYDDICFFDFDIYGMVRDFLDDTTRLFWDSLYAKQVNFPGTAKNLFLPDWYFDSTDFAYSIPENYYLTRERIESLQLNFYHASLGKILNKENTSNYAAIFLSNIYNYLSRDDKGNYYTFIKGVLAERLSIDGSISVYAPPYIRNPEIIEYDGTLNSYKKAYIYKKER